MDMYLWDNYALSEINDKLRYWVDLWDDMCEGYRLNLRSDFSNPRSTLVDIVDELSLNRINNHDNRKLFTEKIGEYLRQPCPVSKEFRSDFVLLIKSFQAKKGEIFIIELCKIILRLFEKGLYLDALTRSLKES